MQYFGGQVHLGCSLLQAGTWIWMQVRWWPNCCCKGGGYARWMLLGECLFWKEYLVNVGCNLLLICATCRAGQRWKAVMGWAFFLWSNKLNERTWFWVISAYSMLHSLMHLTLHAGLWPTNISLYTSTHSTLHCMQPALHTWFNCHNPMHSTNFNFNLS